MPGAFTQQLDAVQVITALFFLFFAGLIYYLRREDKREGYPLIDVSPVNTLIEGWPAMPPPKTYLLLEGGQTQMPHYLEPSLMRAAPMQRHLGAPLVPIGDPMTAEVGPGAYPLREDYPFMSEGRPQVQPMRTARGWDVAAGDSDPRGMRVLDSAKQPVGTVVDLWVDRGVKLLRYLEVRLDGEPETVGGTDHPLLVPLFRTQVRGKRRVVLLQSMLAGHLRMAPRLKSANEITMREEDRVNAYFSAALMYGGTYVGGDVHLGGMTPAARIVG